MRGGLLTGHATFDGFQHIVADILFGLDALIGDTGSFRKSDGARQTDAAIHGGLATRHAALDGFQHVVADIVAEFMYAFRRRRKISESTGAGGDRLWKVVGGFPVSAAQSITRA